MLVNTTDPDLRLLLKYQAIECMWIVSNLFTLKEQQITSFVYTSTQSHEVQTTPVYFIIEYSLSLLEPDLLEQTIWALCNLLQDCSGTMACFVNDNTSIVKTILTQNGWPKA